MKKFLAVGILAFPSFAVGQDNGVANFYALVNSETAFSVQAGAAAACGFRSKRWTESVLVYTITGVENVSRNLWPGNNKNGLSNFGQHQFDAAENQMANGFRFGKTADPSDCTTLASTDDLETIDRMLSAAHLSPDLNQ